VNGVPAANKGKNASMVHLNVVPILKKSMENVLQNAQLRVRPELMEGVKSLKSNTALQNTKQFQDLIIHLQKLIVKSKEENGL
jgi:hypothetical protein